MSLQLEGQEIVEDKAVSFVMSLSFWYVKNCTVRKIVVCIGMFSVLIWNIPIALKLTVNTEKLGMV